MKKKVPSWATQNGIRVGRRFVTVDGVKIREANRVTNFAYRRRGIQELMDFQKLNYTSKGVHSVLFGIKQTGKTQIAYAVYCEIGNATDG